MDTRESVYNIIPQLSRRLLLEEDVAMRLYNDISRGSVPLRTESLPSICSANEFGQSCRICRWNRNDLPIQQCPCECKGSVGYVHLKCLQRWIIHRGDDHCEICGTRFHLMPEERSYTRLFWSFFQWKYFGTIFKGCINLLSLAPISYVVLYQVLQIMDNLQLEDNSTWHIVFLAPALLLTSSIIFFHILEFAVTRCLIMKNALKHWWKFGGQEADPTLDTDVPSELFEFF